MTEAYRELLAGCGHRHSKIIKPPERPDWENLTTLDANPACAPDVLHDLNERPLPFPDDHFAEIHFYDVLEHIGRQGDAPGFFEEFADYWRILKPGGILCALVPHYSNEWAWGDPGHVRVITAGTLVWLDREAVRRQLGKTPMSDYRALWPGDFEIAHLCQEGASLGFVLKAVKPPRPW